MEIYKKLACFFSIVALLGCTKKEDIIKLVSPDKNVEIEINTENSSITFNLDYNGQKLLDKSPLAIELNKQIINMFEIVSVEKNSEASTWKPVVGQFEVIKNEYNEITLVGKSPKWKGGIKLIFRMFDDGIAYRYTISSDNKKEIKVKDVTEFNFLKDHQIYSTNGEHAPTISMLSKENKELKPPVVVNTGDQCALFFHEADLNNFSFLRMTKGSKPYALKCNAEVSVRYGSFSTPWRVIGVGGSQGEFMISSLLQNLNPPPNQDFSWLKDGLSFNECRVWGANIDGFVYGKNTETFERLIDYGSKNNISYLQIDSGWYGDQRSPKSNPLTPRQDEMAKQKLKGTSFKVKKNESKGILSKPHLLRGVVDMQKLIKYGEERGVGIVLYINDMVRYTHGMAYLENVLKTYHEWGAKGIKYGFMKSKSPQDKVRQTAEITKLCAKYELYVVYHDGPVHPTGEDRTYPNKITEFCHGQFDSRRTFTPTTFINTILVNMIGGPLDMQNGFFELGTEFYKERLQAVRDLNSTVVAEVARTLITYSPLKILVDHDAAYESKKDLFEFISEQPGSWDDTKIIHAEFNEHISMARRKGSKWFVGSVINEAGGSLQIPLSFLDKNKEYQATIYQDMPTTHYLKEKNTYKITTKKVTYKDVISANLAPGGGHAIWIH